MELNDILDQIEEQHALSDVLRNNRALAKALRKAMQGFQLIEVCDGGIKDAPDRVVSVSLIREWQSEIASILKGKTP